MDGRSVEELQQEIEALFVQLGERSLVELTEGEVAECTRRSQRLRSMAEAHCVRSAGALDASQAWVADGARSAAAWIAWRCRTSPARAKAATGAARTLRSMPGTEAAFLAGALTADHVRLLGAAREAAPAHFDDGGEELLLESAALLLYPQFERVARRWRYWAEADAGEAEAAQRWDDRHLHAARTFAGMVAIDGMLDPTTGAIVLRQLERLERELFEEDLAEARERLGATFSLVQLRRTPAQRRADALARMAERSATKPAGATEARVLVHVLAGRQSLERMCELSDGTTLTPGEVLPILDRADVERIVFDGAGRVIDVGPRRRLFTGATRTAVQLRDRRCVHPSCDVPAERCEIDHIQPYDDGGLTIQINGRCLCRYHHRRARPSP